MINPSDLRTIRSLAARAAEIAALPVQEEKRRLWRKLNALKPERPMVMIDQVCWNEMETGAELRDALALRTADPDCRYYEEILRQMLFQWDHFRVDMVVEPFIRVPMAIENTGFGIEVNEQIAVLDATNSVVGHYYNNQFHSMDDLEKVQTPRLIHDPAETNRRLEVAHQLFDGLLEVRPWGLDQPITIWDPISTWMGVEKALYAIIDQPELMHALVARMVAGYLSLYDQAEEQGLLCGPQSLVHCTGAWTDELPAPGYDPQKPRTKDLWTFGLAQMFSTVSPRMFKEFEVDYIKPICERFGLVYYGCCDPLDGKMKQVRMIPNVRKVSMSPWTNQERGAAEIHGDYVFSRKPSPAFLAWDGFDSESVRADLAATRDTCVQYNCPLELILKDISTVRYEPQRLFQWAEVAMQVVC
ncbi:MAG: hypothetical protein EHM21_10565 [Chloroflexi bacterium]|nr:MAG: hypothetical protein EHM21_10565 [Chloroflexota bacterium]